MEFAYPKISSDAVVSVEVESRGKRKYVTLIKGLAAFGVLLSRHSVIRRY